MIKFDASLESLIYQGVGLLRTISNYSWYDKKIHTSICLDKGDDNHVESILSCCYNSDTTVINLIGHGRILRLGSKINPDPNIEHSINSIQENITVFFERDLNWHTLEDPIIHDPASYKEFIDCMHNEYPRLVFGKHYMYARNQWYYFKKDPNYLEVMPQIVEFDNIL